MKQIRQYKLFFPNLRCCSTVANIVVLLLVALQDKMFFSLSVMYSENLSFNNLLSTAESNELWCQSNGRRINTSFIPSIICADLPLLAYFCN